MIQPPARGIVLLLALLIAPTSALAAPKPATKPATATAPTTAPSASDIISAFLEGKIDTLESALPALKDAAVPPKEKSDIAYIRQAVAENRPAWWNQTKAGRTVNFRPVIWGRQLVATFDPNAKNGVEVSWNNNKPAATVTWAFADMDSPVHAEHGFSKGELADLGVWMTLGNADAWVAIPPSAYSSFNTDAAKLALQRYLEFRGTLTAVHYGLPRARRWGLWLCCAFYMNKYAESPTVMSRKAVASAFIVEILSKPDKFPSIKLTPEKDATEEAVALRLKDIIEKTPWTLAEDKLLRDAMKTLATANELAVLRNGRIALPNGLAVALDAAQDAPLREKRDAWVKQQIAKLKK